MDPATRAEVELIGRYLARRDPVSAQDRYDVLVLCGSGVLATVVAAAHAFHEGLVAGVLVTGGVGHSTPYLVEAVTAHPVWNDSATADRPEAAIIADILKRHLDVPATAITTEEQATNCGENAALTLPLLPPRARVVLVQDPTMQRRTHAGFDHHQRLLGTDHEVVSQAPFVPVVGNDGVGDDRGNVAWTLDRFVSLALGEIRRLRDDEHGYGPRGAGFLDHVDVPAEVLQAAERVAQALGNQVTGDQALPNLRSRLA